MNDKYPRYASEFSDLSVCIDTYLLAGLPTARVIGPKSKIFTQGSCFATNIYDALKSRGADVEHLTVRENSNSPIGNAKGLESADDATASRLRKVDVFIFTMGVSLEVTSETSWRFCSVEENATALRKITTALRTLNPEMSIVYSVSPVPLNRAVGLGMSGMMADCLSKSTLRVAIAEHMKEATNGVFYWPSFEMVRWIGAHTGPAYGQDDDLTRHVNKSLVALIVDKFLGCYGSL